MKADIDAAVGRVLGSGVTCRPEGEPSSADRGLRRRAARGRLQPGTDAALPLVAAG
jgi:hypothetical protein